MSVLPVGFGSSGGYQITNSVRLRAAASAYFSRTFGTPTAANTWTVSWWEKKTRVGASGEVFMGAGASATNNAIWTTWNTTDIVGISNSAGSALCTSTAVIRDPSAHYHFCVVNNAGTFTIYRNNVSIATGSGTCNINQAGTVHYMGAANGTYYSDGYLSDVYFIDGQALTPSSFGENNSDGVWVPKAYTGTYGTNGFHLDFKDAALTAGSNVGLGKDVSGNGNYWNTNNISVTAGVTYDSMVDTPTNNYATLNPLWTNASYMPTNANLNTAAAAAYHGTPGTMAIPSGMKAYWEFVVGTDLFGGVGVARMDATAAERDANPGVADSSRKVRFCRTQQSGVEYKLDGTTLTNNGAVNLWASGEVWGVALDGAKLWIRNGAGTWVGSGDPAAGTNAYISDVPTTVDIAAYISNYNSAWSINFGQRPFTYTPPTGFKSLCTANLPAVAIAKPALHMDVATHTGTGSGKSITGIQFQPDLYWGKSRNATYMQDFVDSVRGVTKHLRSDATSAESDLLENGGKITSFNSDGYTLANGTVNNSWNNETSVTYVSWLWKANGAGVSNTDGSITSTVSANQTAGFSIVTYTGTGANATVGHGLGVAPKMVIVKRRVDAGYQWPVYHASLTSALYKLLLSTTDAQASSASTWNSTAPTSTVFSIGTDTEVNGNTKTNVAYCFAEVPGYSKFGSYVGNGSADGPFVYCGFRPKYVLIKNSTGAYNWFIFDALRGGYNAANNYLLPNSTGAENSYTGVDFTANGFKMLNADGGLNSGSDTYIFAAFAEFPFGGSNVAPSPAR